MPAQSKPVALTPFASALAGALGGCFSTAVVYPLDVAKTRIQALPKGKDSKDNLSAIAVLLRILKKEGLSGWYRGFGATMLNTFSMQYAYFFFYSFVRTSYINRLTRKLPPGSKLPPLSTAVELLLGAIAGALGQIFTIPVAVIATRQQVGRPAPKILVSKPTFAQVADPETALPAPLVGGPNGGSAQEKTQGEDDMEYSDDTFLGVAREIVEEEGVTGLWLGLKPGLVLTVNPAITYGMYERVKSIVLLAGATKMSPGMTFLIGALSKTLATVVTYPYIMAKVRIQARSADAEDATEEHHAVPHAHHYHHDKFRHPGALDILMRVWKKEGFVGWYQGMQAQITKAVLSQALLFWSKEHFEQWALAILIVFAKLARR